MGDAHGDLFFLDRACVAAKKAGAGLIVQVGDWGYLWPGAKCLRAANEILYNNRMTCVFIDGNHDWHPQLYTVAAITDGGWEDSYENVYCARGTPFEWKGVRMVGMGGAPSIDRPRRVEGKSWWPEEVIGPADVARALTNEQPVHVLVTHDAPFLPATVRDLENDSEFKWFAPMARSSRDDVAQVQLHLQPRLTVHGHYHVGGFNGGHLPTLALAHNYNHADALRVVRFAVGEDGTLDGYYIEGYGDPEADAVQPLDTDG